MSKATCSLVGAAKKEKVKAEARKTNF